MQHSGIDVCICLHHAMRRTVAGLGRPNIRPTMMLHDCLGLPPVMDNMALTDYCHTVSQSVCTLPSS